jgi:hypothetical protein
MIFISHASSFLTIDWLYDIVDDLIIIIIIITNTKP